LTWFVLYLVCSLLSSELGNGLRVGLTPQIGKEGVGWLWVHDPDVDELRHPCAGVKESFDHQPVSAPFAVRGLNQPPTSGLSRRFTVRPRSRGAKSFSARRTCATT
jgi:hypothetical protein